MTWDTSSEASATGPRVGKPSLTKQAACHDVCAGKKAKIV
jgi:hypothetical protein